mmetsp:Transcript_14099/g.48867  ORF Transcript_14099/g.48867 Transcript_14099/m.48867 type:complete len:259 (+) Transcript_14099:3105-3881(+)
MPAVAKAHVVLAMFCGEKRETIFVPLNAAAAKSRGAETPALAKAQTVFAICCAEKVSMISGASSPTASNMAGAEAPAFAKAQTVLDMSCELACGSCKGTADAMAAKSAGASTPALEKAHAVEARSCELYDPIFSTASFAIAAKKASDATPTLEMPHAAFASWRAVHADPSTFIFAVARWISSCTRVFVLRTSVLRSVPRRCSAVERFTALKSTDASTTSRMSRGLVQATSCLFSACALSCSGTGSASPVGDHVFAAAE